MLHACTSISAVHMHASRLPSFKVCMQELAFMRMTQQLYMICA